MTLTAWPEVENRENPNVSPQGREPELSSQMFQVLIIDNDVNTYQEVIDICMLALGVDFEHAYKIALAVDNNGFCDVLHAPENEARQAADLIGAIGIQVQVKPL